MFVLTQKSLNVAPVVWVGQTILGETPGWLWSVFPGRVRGSMVPRPHRACLRARGAGSCPENHQSPSQGFLCPFGTLGRGSALVSPPGASSHSLSNSAHRNCANMVMP